MLITHSPPDIITISQGHPRPFPPTSPHFRVSLPRGPPQVALLTYPGPITSLLRLSLGSHLHCAHEPVITVLQELRAEVSEEESHIES